jgi:Ca2+-binding RTX toxin-like protein
LALRVLNVDENGGPGPDSLNGGAGADTATYVDRTNPVNVSVGSGYNDGEAGEGDNVRPTTENVIGGSGGDTLIGSGVANQLYRRGGADTSWGDLGADLLDGEGGVDLASYAGHPSAVTVTLDGAANDGSTGGAEGDNVLAEQVQGTGFDDDITGDGAANELLGKGGNDTLDGGMDPTDVLNGGVAPTPAPTQTGRCSSAADPIPLSGSIRSPSRSLVGYLGLASPGPPRQPVVARNTVPL